MKHAFMATGLLLAGLAAFPASAGPVLKVSCPEGVYHQKPFDFTVDLATREVAMDDFFMEVIPDGIAGNTITFGYMRGNAVFHRDTHVFEWDARAEYSYLDAIGHPASVSIDDFMGSAVCTVEEKP